MVAKIRKEVTSNREEAQQEGCAQRQPERRGNGSTTVLGVAVNELGMDVRALGCGGVSSNKVARHGVEPVLLRKEEGVWVSDRTLG
jgi:RNA 3'-terminal phosphate cyclase